MWKISVIPLLIALALAAACGDDDDSEEVSVCDARSELQESVSALTDLDVISSGTDGVTAAVDAIREDLSGLRDAVSSEIEPEVEELETAVGDARAILADIDDDSSLNERIDAVQAALTGIVDAAGGLTTALDEEC